MTTSSKVTLEDEIVTALAAIGSEGASGYHISRWIEDHSPPKPWRFLWWSGYSERWIGIGSLYRALDKLVRAGTITRTVDPTREPPRFTYRLRKHTAWCDSGAPPTIYGDRLECNCDPTNPNSKSAYNFFGAIQNIKVLDHEMQRVLFGDVVLPDVDAGTVWQSPPDAQPQGTN